MKNYVVIDFETTGLDHKVEQIIEVALIKYDKEFNELGSFNTFVKLTPGKELSPFIKEYTGITEKQLENGMNEIDAMRIVKSFIDLSTIVVAQYVPFDFAFMAKHGILPHRFICTKSLTSQVEPEETSSLKPTCERLGIKLDNPHRAFADVKATTEVLKVRLSQDIDYLLNTIVKSPDRDLGYIPFSTERVLNKEYFLKGVNR